MKSSPLDPGAFRCPDTLFRLTFTTRGAGPATCVGKRRRSGRVGGDELESPLEDEDDLDVPRAPCTRLDASITGFLEELALQKPGTANQKPQNAPLPRCAKARVGNNWQGIRSRVVSYDRYVLWSKQNPAMVLLFRNLQKLADLLNARLLYQVYQPSSPRLSCMDDQRLIHHNTTNIGGQADNPYPAQLHTWEGLRLVNIKRHPGGTRGLIPRTPD